MIKLIIQRFLSSQIITIQIILLSQYIFFIHIQLNSLLSIFMASVIKKLSSEYETLANIGKGSFGQVEKVQHKKNKNIYAMKLISNINPMVIEEIQKQINIMKGISSPYALGIYDKFYDDYENCYCIVSNFYERGDLKKVIDKNQFPLNDDEIAKFIIQITLAFLELNSKNIIHRDLKPANILITNEIDYKVCDFGCSKFIQNDASKFLQFSNPFGTQMYLSPEVYYGQQGTAYNKSVDVWSLGIILYQIIYHKHPVKMKNDNLVFEDVEAIFKKKKPINFDKVQTISPYFIELLKQMLEINYEKRIRWPGILQFMQKNFDHIIYKLEQVVNHQFYLTKMFCLLIDLINKVENTNYLADNKVQRKTITNLVNCLIMLQYDVLADTEEWLKKRQKPKRNYILLPVYQEFNEPDNKLIQQFKIRKEKNRTFRNIIADNYPLQKVMVSVQKAATEIYKVLQNLPNKSNQMTKITEMLSLVQALRKQCYIRNSNWMQKHYKPLI